MLLVSNGIATCLRETRLVTGHKADFKGTSRETERIAYWKGANKIRYSAYLGKHALLEGRMYIFLIWKWRVFGRQHARDSSM